MYLLIFFSLQHNQLNISYSGSWAIIGYLCVFMVIINIILYIFVSVFIFLESEKKYLNSDAKALQCIIQLFVCMYTTHQHNQNRLITICVWSVWREMVGRRWRGEVAGTTLQRLWHMCWGTNSGRRNRQATVQLCVQNENGIQSTAFNWHGAALFLFFVFFCSFFCGGVGGAGTVGIHT